MSFDLICSKCGAASGPAVGVCPFCKSVLAKPKDNGSPQLALIEKAMADGKLQEALAFATEAAHKPEFANDDSFLVLYARILIETEGPASKTKSLLARACLADSKNGEARELLEIVEAKGLFTHNAGDAGEAALRALLKKSPKNALALFILGAHLFWIQKETEESRRLLERAVQLRPRHLRSWGCLGEIYRKSGNIAAAAKAFAKCEELETDPEMRRFFKERAQA